MYASASDFPAGEPALSVSQSVIDSLLSDSAGWWSTNTGLDFQFTQPSATLAINEACGRDTLADAMTALGTSDSSYRTSGRDLLIFRVYPANTSCPVGAASAYTVAPVGNVFAGGMFDAPLMTSMTSVSDFSYSPLSATLSHEFGHTLGLMHSSLSDCSSVIWPGDDLAGPSWDGWFVNQSACAPIEYGDDSTVMGMPSYLAPFSLNSLQRLYLGVPGPGDGPEVIDAATSDNVVTLSRSDVASSGMPNGLVVQGSGSSIGVDYRAPGSTGSSVQGAPGVYVTLSRMVGYQGSGLYTDLLTPVGFASGGVGVGFNGVALGVGQTYVSSDGRVSVEVLSLSADGTSAQIKVSVGAVAGVPGGVSVSQDGSVLAANVTSSAGSVSVSYRWFRDGQPIAGAASRTFEPVLPDPDAVYRVEATLSAPGLAASTHSSRGIVPDDQRFGLSGTTATLVFVDENGNPVDCAGNLIHVTISAESGQAISFAAQVDMSPTSALGTCLASVPLDSLTGDFRVTASGPSGLLALYWQPLSAPVAVTAGGASAALLVGYGDYGAYGNQFGNSWPTGAPILRAGVGELGLPATVSVTDSTGAPAAGVAVDLTGTAGLVFTPAAPVTGVDGLAHTTVDWDPMVAPPAQDFAASVTATVAGVIVTGSPAPVEVYAGAQGRVSGWFEGPTTVSADGVSVLTVHVRAWDEIGALLVNRPDLVSLGIGASGPVVGPVAWDPTGQDYVASITSNFATSGQVSVKVSSDPGGSGVTVVLYPTVTFQAGPLASLFGSTYSTSGVAASVGGCSDATPTALTVGVISLDASGNIASLASQGDTIVFSLPAGSPLTFVSNPVVTASTMIATDFPRYLVQVASPKAGTFNMTATTLDGSMSTTFPVDFIDGPVDPAESTVRVGAGPRQADGRDAYTVTTDLATTCHLPVTDLSGINGSWLEVNLTDPSTGLPATGATVSSFAADPSTPGRYTATVTSTQPGTDDLTVVYSTRYDFLTNAMYTRITSLNPSPIPLEFTDTNPTQTTGPTDTGAPSSTPTVTEGASYPPTDTGGPSAPVTDTSTPTGGASPSDTTGPVPSDTEAPSSPVGVAGLSVAAVVSSSVVDRAGAAVAFSFVVVNAGDAAVNGLAVGVTGFTGSGPAPAFACAAGWLAVGEQTTCTGSYLVTRADFLAGEPVTVTVVASGTAGGGAVASDPVGATVRVAAVGGLGLVKTAEPGSVTAAGEAVVYTFAVANTGNVALMGVVVDDAVGLDGAPVCRSVAAADGAALAGSCAADGTAALAPGETATFTATHTVTAADLAAGTITNTATASGVSAGPCVGACPPVVSDPSTASVAVDPGLGPTPTPTPTDTATPSPTDTGGPSSPPTDTSAPPSPTGPTDTQSSTQPVTSSASTTATDTATPTNTADASTTPAVTATSTPSGSPSQTAAPTATDTASGPTGTPPGSTSASASTSAVTSASRPASSTSGQTPASTATSSSSSSSSTSSALSPSSRVYGLVDGSASKTVRRGETVAVTGFGFAAGERVRFVLRSDPVTLGVFTADSDGSVAGLVTIPLDTALGAHTIVETGAASGREATVGIEVVAESGATAASPGTAAPAGTGTVAYTGAGPISSLARVALLSVIAGGALLAITRRTRHQHTH